MSTSSIDTTTDLLVETVIDDLVQELSGETFDVDLDFKALKSSKNESLDDSSAHEGEVHDAPKLQTLKVEDNSAIIFDSLEQSTIVENAPSEASWNTPGSVSSVVLSGQNHIDSLLSGQKWGGGTGTGVNLTYSFGEWGTSWYAFNDYPQPGAEPWNGFSPLTATQKNATKNALAAWSDIANVQFTEVTDSETVAGDLRFAKSNNPGTAWAYYPDDTASAGDVWFSHNSVYDTDAKGTYGYATFMHEIGHALGLEHPHEAGFGGSADLSIDTTHYTVMSYRSYFNQPVDAGYSQSFYSTSPLLNDIAAIQYLYGANMSTRSGDTVYSWAPGQQIFEAIWDAGGTDTIDWSNQTSAAKINLGAGQWSELGPTYWNGQADESQTLAIAYNVTIENANGGSGNDTITGNDVGNVLSGNDGNDYIDGWGGDDGLYGNGGNDTLLGWYGNDYLDGWTGDDSLYGEAGNDTLLGYDGNDFLDGGDGADYLRGEAGNDTITGGAGADIFAFDTPWDGVDIFTDFQWEQGDKIQASGSGFGIASGDTSRFTYDGLNLYFDSTKLAELVNPSFNVNLDIHIV